MPTMCSYAPKRIEKLGKLSNTPKKCRNSELGKQALLESDYDFRFSVCRFNGDVEVLRLIVTILSPCKRHWKCPFTYLWRVLLGIGRLISRLIVRVFAIAFGCIRAQKFRWSAENID
ncbi:hypothetical protein Y032_0014g2403 [Ancylostoma ceylanicum]|uniref:Uncharacterized protein n=1 Tax=Ancylostoma ceylanicum TaxID=53326 RepID=A0A016V9Y0_9BILA|nr:hypothetical protein Y032_0014g2403 [Ancylostoma ceylanicum]